MYNNIIHEPSGVVTVPNPRSRELLRVPGVTGSSHSFLMRTVLPCGDRISSCSVLASRFARAFSRSFSRAASRLASVTQCDTRQSEKP